MEAAHRAQIEPSDTVAGVLSLVIPGAGQIYKGKALVGIMWLVLTAAGYLTLFVPGILLHFLCVMQAYGMGRVGRL